MVQQTPAWKWIVAAAAMLLFAAVILLPAKHGAYAANITYDAPYASDAPGDQSIKPSPFPEKPVHHRAKPVETPSSDKSDN